MDDNRIHTIFYSIVICSSSIVQLLGCHHNMNSSLRGILLCIIVCLCSGAEARKLYDEAQVMLKQIIRDKSLQAHGVVGLYRASRDGDDVHVLAEDGSVIATLFGLRQQVSVVCRTL